jgi:hypothetical protein
MWQHTPEPLKKKKKLFSMSFRRNIFPNFFVQQNEYFQKTVSPFDNIFAQKK